MDALTPDEIKDLMARQLGEFTATLPKRHPEFYQRVIAGRKRKQEEKNS